MDLLEVAYAIIIGPARLFEDGSASINDCFGNQAASSRLLCGSIQTMVAKNVTATTYARQQRSVAATLCLACPYGARVKFTPFWSAPVMSTDRGALVW